VGGRGEEGQAVVLAGEAVGGVHLAVAARAEGGLVGAADHARLGRLARGAENLHGSSEPIDHYTIIRVEGRGRRRRGRGLRLELWIDREGGRGKRCGFVGLEPPRPVGDATRCRPRVALAGARARGGWQVRRRSDAGRDILVEMPRIRMRMRWGTDHMGRRLTWLAPAGNPVDPADDRRRCRKDPIHRDAAAADWTSPLCLSRRGARAHGKRRRVSVKTTTTGD
jgi:hypothetical protein